VLANGGTMFGATEFASADGLDRRTEPVVIGSLLSQLLDRGEASVVQLAISEGIETVCIDEHQGRRVARLNGLRVTGSLGFLFEPNAKDTRSAFPTP
jgi:predicted nucleic acid-binding protein